MNDDPEGAVSSESGRWGAAALWILVVLFVLAAAATVHSIWATVLA